MGVTVDVNEMKWIHPTMAAIQNEIRSTRVVLVQLLLRMLQQVETSSARVTNQWMLTNSVLNTTSTEALIQFTETNRIIAHAVENKLAHIMVGAGIVVVLLFVYLAAIFVALTGFGCWYMYLQQQRLKIKKASMNLDHKDRAGISDEDSHMGTTYQATGSTRVNGYQRIPDEASAAA